MKNTTLALVALFLLLSWLPSATQTLAPAKQAIASSDPLRVLIPPIRPYYPPDFKGVRNPPTTLEGGAIELLTEAHVPGGVAIFFPDGAFGDKPKYYPRLPPAERTLGESLRAWLALEPGYRVLVDQGAVDVVPNKLPPLLLTRFWRFDYSGARSGAVNALQVAPEFRAAMIKMGLHYGVQIGEGLVPPVPPPSITLHLRNVTLLQALNAISRAENGSVWKYQQRDKTNLAIR